MKDRVRQLMESQHMNQKNFADYTGISSATLSGIFNGRTQPTLAHVDKLKMRFPTINLDWLIFGRGEMFMENKSAETTPSGQDSHVHQEPLLEFESEISMPSGSSYPSSGSHSVPVGGAITPSGTVPTTSYMHGVENTPYKNEKNIVKIVDKKQRMITEIRVFYDDQTWETFTPKK